MLIFEGHRNDSFLMAAAAKIIVMQTEAIVEFGELCPKNFVTSGGLSCGALCSAGKLRN